MQRIREWAEYLSANRKRGSVVILREGGSRFRYKEAGEESSPSDREQTRMSLDCY
jgi:hypothetical protein